MATTKNWWEYRDARQALKAYTELQNQQAQEDEGGGGGIFSGVVGDVLGTAAKPIKYAGGKALEGLAWYNKRFTTPTAAWLADALEDIHDDTGLPNLGINFIKNQEGARINPLRAWYGDEDEMTKAEEYMATLNPLMRFALEAVADPTTWLPIGSGLASKGLIKTGALMMGTHSKNLEAALTAKNIARVGFRSLVPGGKSLAQKSVHGDSLAHLFGGAVGSPERSAAGRSLIAAGAILNTISGTPEILFDAFLRGGVRPITENIPSMRLVMQMKDGQPVIRPSFGMKLAQESPRSQVENAHNTVIELSSTVRQKIAAETGQNPIELSASDVISRMTDPTLDTGDFSPWAKDAHQWLTTENITVDDLMYRSQVDGAHDWAIEHALSERIAEAKRIKFGLPTETDIMKMPVGSRIAARVFRLKDGMRLYNSKLAATWIHGALFSSLFPGQNWATNPVLAGLAKLPADPEYASLMFPSAGRLYDQFAKRAGLGHRTDTITMKNAANRTDAFTDVTDDVTEAGIGMMSETHMAHPSRKMGFGYVVEQSDKLAHFMMGRDSRVSRALGKTLKGGARAPQALAQSADENFYRAINETMYDRTLRSLLGNHPDANVAILPDWADGAFTEMKNLGATHMEARAISTILLNAHNPAEALDRLRQFTKINRGKFIGVNTVTPNAVIPPEIFDSIRQVVDENYDGGMTAILHGKKGKVRLSPSEGKYYREDTKGLEWVKREKLAQHVIDNQDNQAQFLREGMHQFVRDNVPSKSVQSSMGGLIDSTHDAHDRLGSVLKAAMTNKKSTATDVAFFGDIFLRLEANRAGVHRLIKTAVDDLALDPNTTRKWQVARNKITLANNAFEKEMGDMIQAATKARLNAFKEIPRGKLKGMARTGEDSTQGMRKAWGDFRAKYDKDGVLPTDPDADAMAAFMRKRTNEESVKLFDELYKVTTINGSDVGVEVNWFQAMQSEIDHMAGDIAKQVDGMNAGRDAVFARARELIDEMPQRDPKVASAMFEANTKASRQALDMTTERLGSFYDGATGMDELLSWVFPFSRFGTRILSAGPRAASRAPNMVPMFERWQALAEKEFSPVQSWVPLGLGSVFVNPFNLLAPYQQYQALTDPRVFGEGNIEQLTSALGQGGLGVGPGSAAILAHLGQMNPSGDIIPGQKALRAAGAGLDMAGIPYGNLPDDILNNVTNLMYNQQGGNETFEREVEKILADRGINPASVSHDSDEWKSAERKAAINGLANYGGAGLGLREIPIERVEYAKREANAIANVANISTEAQFALRRKDDSAWSLINAEQRDAIIAQIGEESYRAHTAVMPIGLTLEERNRWHNVQSHYITQNIQTQRLDDEIRSIGNQLITGQIDGQKYREAKRQAFAVHYAILEAQKRETLSVTMGADVKNPDLFTSDQVYQMFNDEKDKLRRSAGREVNRTLLPEDEALESYRNINPDDYTNPITGEVEWDTWTDARELFMATQPNKIRDYIARIEANKLRRDPVELLYQQAKTEMDAYQEITPYLGVRPEDLDLAKEAISAVQLLTDRGLDQNQAVLLVQQQNPQAGILARVALRSKNPERTAYWKSHPLLSLFFSG